jgi:hypothetical protein
MNKSSVSFNPGARSKSPMLGLRESTKRQAEALAIWNDFTKPIVRTRPPSKSPTRNINPSKLAASGLKTSQ